MKKIWALIFTFILLSTSPVMAGEFHGKVYSRVELFNDYSGQQWGIDLHYDFSERFFIGSELVCMTDGLGKNNIGFSPVQQTYEVYLAFNVNDNLTLKLSQWCIHSIISTSDRTLFISGDMTGIILRDSDTMEGIYLMAELEF